LEQLPHLIRHQALNDPHEDTLSTGPNETTSKAGDDGVEVLAEAGDEGVQGGKIVGLGHF
ncbi:hypothetical protein ACFYWX_43155, partial [Streptomyces sp. NPDC002888]|uniref:hypothetical protein n=1 Tax=Streptomyces sp. NPDC002888 TaxID=3364668 RepID=UPI003678B1E3